MLLEEFDDSNSDNCFLMYSDENEKPQLAFRNDTATESNLNEVHQQLGFIHQQEEQTTSAVDESNQTPTASSSQEQNRLTTNTYRLS